jgi:hypothetical protein
MKLFKDINYQLIIYCILFKISNSINYNQKNSESRNENFERKIKNK